MGAVRRNTQAKIRFYILKEFLSPKFNAINIERALNVEIELLDSPPWPEYLKNADGSFVGIWNDKQRLIWAYKILFLDTLFHGKTERVIFVD